MYPSLPDNFPPVVALVASRLRDEFTGVDVAVALAAVKGATIAADGEVDPWEGWNAARVLGALRASEMASVVEEEPPAVYRLHRDLLPL